MRFHPCYFSYSAGSNSRNPYGYRIVDETTNLRLDQLMELFPSVSQFLKQQPLIVSAYPATLGLTGITALVDTYLHPPTFIRALRLAACENASVLLAAQPLVGAELLLQHCKEKMEVPRHILWAVGGYYFPLSLENFIRKILAGKGCDITFLYSYGVAEIGHTCFAGISRLSCGEPLYQKVATEVTARIKEKELVLEAGNNRSVATGDYAQIIQGGWLIKNNITRLAPAIRDELESWTATDWLRRTGNLQTNPEGKITYQLRERKPKKKSKNEIPYYSFWDESDNYPTSKPCWGLTQEGNK